MSVPSPSFPSNNPRALREAKLCYAMLCILPTLYSLLSLFSTPVFQKWTNTSTNSTRFPTQEGRRETSFKSHENFHTNLAGKTFKKKKKKKKQPIQMM